MPIAPIYKLNNKIILTEMVSNVFQNTFTIHLGSILNSGMYEFNGGGCGFGVGPKLR